MAEQNAARSPLAPTAPASPIAAAAPVAPAAPAPASPVFANASAALSKSTEAAKSAITKATSMFSNTSTMSIVGGAVVAAIVALVIAYILYYLITTNITNRKSILLPESKLPLPGTSYTDVNASGIPSAGNGKRMTMAFWIYINDITAYRGLYRHVLHRGDKSLAGASPLIFLDKNTNKLYVRFEMTPTKTQETIKSMATPFIKKTEVSSKDATQYSTSATDAIADEEMAIRLDLMARGISIDYIPVQRWVHVAVVVNEEINMGTISAYIDGELVKSVSSDKTDKDLVVTQVTDVNGAALTSSTVPVAPAAAPAKLTNNPLHYNFQNLILDKGGDVWVGGNPQDASIGPGFDGLVSGIMFANYDMNAKDVYDVYMRGPIDNVLAKMGLPAYAVRSPVYRVG